MVLNDTNPIAAGTYLLIVRYDIPTLLATHNGGMAPIGSFLVLGV